MIAWSVGGSYIIARDHGGMYLRDHLKVGAVSFIIILVLLYIPYYFIVYKLFPSIDLWLIGLM